MGSNDAPVPLVHSDAWDDALVSLAGGDHPDFDERVVHRHLAGCQRCRGLADPTWWPSTSGALPPAPTDLAGRVVRSVAAADRSGARLAIRAGLMAIGVIALIAAFDDLVAGHDVGVAVHASRHLGAFTAAYGVGLLVVAVRPARARTMLPVSVVLGAALLITAALDVAEGHVPLTDEVSHIPELGSILLLWLLADTHRSSAPLRSGS